MDWYVGQRIRCINDLGSGGDRAVLALGGIYTIREIIEASNGVGFRLEEIHNPKITSRDAGWGEPGYLASRFVPAVMPVVELQPDSDAPGLWIGFKSFDDRDRAMAWFSPPTQRAENAA